jgi:hypothetical protein
LSSSWRVCSVSQLVLERGSRRDDSRRRHLQLEAAARGRAQASRTGDSAAGGLDVVARRRRSQSLQSRDFDANAHPWLGFILNSTPPAYLEAVTPLAPDEARERREQFRKKIFELRSQGKAADRAVA